MKTSALRWNKSTSFSLLVCLQTAVVTVDLMTIGQLRKRSRELLGASRLSALLARGSIFGACRTTPHK